MRFQVFHDYNRLVRRGLVPPLTCGHCGTEYAIRLGVDDQPELQCFMCDSRTRPGQAYYDKVVSVVNKHFGYR